MSAKQRGHAKLAKAKDTKVDDPPVQPPSEFSELAPERSGPFWLTLLAPGIMAASVIIGVIQFNIESNDRAQAEFLQNVWSRQMTAYEELGSAVGDILSISTNQNAYITEAEVPKLDSLAKPFRKLYLGTIPLFQDDSVQQALLDFRVDILSYRDRAISYGELAASGLDLMRTCKASSDAGWIELKNQ